MDKSTITNFNNVPVQMEQSGMETHVESNVQEDIQILLENATVPMDPTGMDKPVPLVQKAKCSME